MNDENSMTAMAYSPEYIAHMKQEATRSARAHALDLAVRWAQPGSHADVVIEDARKFFEWLTDAT